jgi:hypothetical protein
MNGGMALICILPVSYSFGSFEVESAVCGSVLSAAVRKVNVLFACELLMEGRKKEQYFDN